MSNDDQSWVVGVIEDLIKFSENEGIDDLRKSLTPALEIAQARTLAKRCGTVVSPDEFNREPIRWKDR